MEIGNLWLCGYIQNLLELAKVHGNIDLTGSIAHTMQGRTVNYSNGECQNSDL